MGITTGTGFAHKIVLDDAGTPVDYIDLFSTKLPEEIKYLGEFGRAALYGESRNLEYYSQPLNRWYSVFLFNDQHLCFTTIYHDITDTKNALEELQKANHLNEILLDSIPHPALLVRKDRKVIAANRLAKEAGTIVGGFCWRDVGHCPYISSKDKKCPEDGSESASKNTSCYFCEIRIKP